MPLLLVSHRQQHQQADCLAACVAMILDYLHVPMNYERLLRLLRVDAIGTSFQNIGQLGSLGLTIQLKEGNLGELQECLDSALPVIAFVNTGELTSYWHEQTNHAVVVIGIEGNLIYLNDPEFEIGSQIISIDEFMLAWEDKDCLYAVIRLQ